jgi:hypothetical protein
MISYTEVVIAIHENVLQEMMGREARLLREIRRVQEDVDLLGNEIREKRFEIMKAKTSLLSKESRYE